LHTSTQSYASCLSSTFRSLNAAIFKLARVPMGWESAFGSVDTEKIATNTRRLHCPPCRQMSRRLFSIIRKLLKLPQTSEPAPLPMTTTTRHGAIAPLGRRSVLRRGLRGAPADLDMDCRRKALAAEQAGRACQDAPCGRPKWQAGCRLLPRRCPPEKELQGFSRLLLTDWNNRSGQGCTVPHRTFRVRSPPAEARTDPSDCCAPGSS
jgi:hypothetical protein